MARESSRLKGLFSNRFAQKIFALLLAFSLWLLVNTGERDVERDLRVGLELRDLPAGLVVSRASAESVDLRVVGPRTLLGRVGVRTVPIDLTGVHPGMAAFEVTPGMFALPRGVRVARISPAKISLSVERLTRKQVPVRVRLAGVPATGYTVVGTLVSPDKVEVVGPASRVEHLESLWTEAVDVSALSQPMTREVRLAAADDMVTPAAERVNVHLNVQDIVTERDFRGVPIEVKNAPVGRYRLSKGAARVLVRGPERLLAGLVLGDGAVFVDAGGGERAKKATLPVTVLLPPEVEVVRLEPSEVRIEVDGGDEKGKARKK